MTTNQEIIDCIDACIGCMSLGEECSEPCRRAVPEGDRESED